MRSLEKKKEGIMRVQSLKGDLQYGRFSSIFPEGSFTRKTLAPPNSEDESGKIEGGKLSRISTSVTGLNGVKGCRPVNIVIWRDGIKEKGEVGGVYIMVLLVL